MMAKLQGFSGGHKQFLQKLVTKCFNAVGLSKIIHSQGLLSWSSMESTATSSADLSHKVCVPFALCSTKIINL